MNTVTGPGAGPTPPGRDRATTQLPTRGAVVASALFLGAALALTACAGARAPRFADRDPVTRLDDARPIPVPPAAEYDLNEYYVRSLVRHPVREGLGFAPPPPAGDVNALDEVPASTWFTPRLGFVDLTPGQLLAGPHDVGPPQPPVTVVKAKVGGGNPGFVIADARRVRYIVKFDPPEFPAIETTTALIVNRLFWGFGYNVPEDHLWFFAARDLGVDPQGELTRADVDAILAVVAPPVDGVYRCTVSRFLQGKILGPIAERGVRPGDANDAVAHEDRRVLRALRVLCAFTNHSDIRPDNSLDVYVGAPGQGHVVHYLLDFGEALGGHGAEHGRPWDGFRPAFAFGDAARHFVGLGWPVEPWERLTPTAWPSVGSLEADAFDPRSWHETWPYLPIAASRPEDDYWAARLVGAVTEAHLRALVEAASYPDADAADYVVRVLVERRRKVLDTFLYAVSPVDAVGCDDGRLSLRDSGRALLGDEEARRRYDVAFLDDDGRPLAPPRRVLADGADFDVEVGADLLAGGYLRVDVLAWRGDEPCPRAAQFHLRPGSDGQPRLVGVVH